MEDFIHWLAATGASAMIQNTVWIIPAVQSVHILCVCVVMASALLLNLQWLGLVGSGEAHGAFTRRYLPWLGAALCLQLLTGAILITGEPGRDLANLTFWGKMLLLLAAVSLTLGLEAPAWRDVQFWETPRRRLLAGILAALALLCWVGIVFCGRWIAYTYDNGG